ncbi:hypothetical protein [Paenibacillus sp. PL2-23]|uniref:hypothetical protein n=1 Tax=Paenibacillus sp. PL2-23 TaxID=2100729 RepID=UPI0030F69CE8
MAYPIRKTAAFGIVKAMGGSLAFENEVGKGTVSFVTLPFAQAATPTYRIWRHDAALPQNFVQGQNFIPWLVPAITRDIFRPKISEDVWNFWMPPFLTKNNSSPRGGSQLPRAPRK